jgi:hypothetical protein
MRVLRRLLKPRTVMPMGMAMGLVFLWELGILPLPVGDGLGPAGHAVVAMLIAITAATAIYLALVAVEVLLARRRARTRTPDADAGEEGS